MLKRALIIGALPDHLQIISVEQDTKLIAGIMEQLGYQICLLVGSSSNYFNIIEAFTWLAEAQVIFFYYTGHGSHGRLITSDKKYLTNSEFKHGLFDRVSKDSKIRILLDCCEGPNLQLKWQYQSKLIKSADYRNNCLNIILISFPATTYEKCGQGVLTRLFSELISATIDTRNLIDNLQNKLNYYNCSQLAQIRFSKLIEMDSSFLGFTDNS